MREEKNKQTNGNEQESCEFSQKQARNEMKKEDERKQIRKMINKL